MAGNEISSISYAMKRAQLSKSTSPRATGSSEVSLNKVGTETVITKKMRRHSYFQLIENRFTGSLKLSTLSIVIPIGGDNNLFPRFIRSSPRC